MSVALRAILGALERGENEQAVVLLVDAEVEAFRAGRSVAGELAYARWRLAGGDVIGATALLHRLGGDAA